MSDVTLKTKDHPLANGRKAEIGDVEWTLKFPMEDGTTLHLKVGKDTYTYFRHFLLCEITDDEIDAALPENRNLDG